MFSKEGNVGSGTSGCSNVGFGFVIAKELWLGANILKGDHHSIGRTSDWKQVAKFFHFKISTVNSIESWRGFSGWGNWRNVGWDRLGNTGVVIRIVVCNGFNYRRMGA